jgi:hypothetical protein
MPATKILIALALCVVLVLAFGLLTKPAHAAKGTGGLGKEVGVGGGDKALAGKKGLAVLGGKKSDPSKQATKLQKMVGVGSIFVMIGVVKWL